MHSRLPFVCSGLAAMTLSACTPAPTGELAHRSTLDVPTKGLRLASDGEGGHAGMMQTNCPFDTESGQVTGDYDLPDEGEEVEDTTDETVLGGATVLLTLDDTIYLLDKSAGDYTIGGTALEGLERAQFLDDGIVAITRTGAECRVNWLALDPTHDNDDAVAGTVYATQNLGCGDFVGLAADSVNHRAVVGVSNELLLVTEDEVVSVPAEADLVAWDEVADAIYVAGRNSHEVHGLNSDGTLRWTHDLGGGEVRDITDGAGAALITVRTQDGSGRVVWLDGWTGDEVTSVETPSAAKRVDVSGNGRVLAATTDLQTHFFDIRDL